MALETDRAAYYQTDPSQLAAALAVALDRHLLLHGVARLGLAVSGGADSVALFHLLLPVCRARGIAVTVLHLNHGLRAEAAEDARFVQTLAAAAQLPCLCGNVHLAERPADGRSLEMAAREARLHFFKHCSREASLDAIATGHHADDVAETLLLRLARGAGAAGLAGLRPRSSPADGCVLIRPLLSVSGGALRAWLTARGLPWCEDASNRDDAIPRNRVRHTLLPQLERMWPSGLRARLCQSSETLREDDALLETLAEQQLASMTAGGTEPPDGLPLDGLLGQPTALQRRILRMWLFRHAQPRAAGLAQVQTLLVHCRKGGDWQLTLPGQTRAFCRNGVLALRAATAAGDVRPVECPLPVPMSQPVRWGGVEFTAESTRGIAAVSDGIGGYPAVCTLGAEALNGHPLTVRARQPGDRIAPTGMTGSKKIQDLFVDAKMPEALRDTVPLVVCGDEVVWVPGYRVARRFAVPSAEAQSVRITARQVSPPRSVAVAEAEPVLKTARHL
jgi:tRNA(Ile)-lysidine synthase